MEAAIRWSPRATPTDAQFLIVDVDARTIKLCEALGDRDGKIKWNEVKRNSKINAFRAFDWSAAHDIVAVGHYAGASVIGLSTGSPSLNLPLKLPRVCNAVAFNSERLLATGVERVRNDYCLNIYDVSHWPAAATSPTESRVVEPSHKLSMSEAITSIKFFPSNPQLLVAGVKGTCLRLYDLRERTGNPALQYSTSQVHNIAVDLCDDHYFAAAGSMSSKSSTIQIWDRRLASSRRSEHGDTKPLLELRDAVETGADEEPTSVWSLRFSPEQRGCLGILGSNGLLKVCQVQRDYVSPSTGANDSDNATPAGSLTLQRTQQISHPQQRVPDRNHLPTAGKDQVISFDFINFFSATGKYQAITLSLQQDIHVHEIYSTPPVLRVSSNGLIVSTDWRRMTSQNSRRKSVSTTGLQVTKETIFEELMSQRQAKLQSSLKFAQSAIRKESADTWRDWEDQVESTDVRPEVVLSNDPIQAPQRVFQEMMKQRVKDGYLLDASKNAQITENEPMLSLFWRWVQAALDNAQDDMMVGGGRDFSFLGVKNIINANLGSEPENRTRNDDRDVLYAISWLAANLGLTGIEVREGEYTARRRLALHALGFRNDNLRMRIQQLAMSGKNTEAALRALILCDNSLVLGALTNGPRRKDMAFLFDDVHKWLTSDEEVELERRKLIGVYLSQEDDPFLHSIYRIMLSDGRQTLHQFDNRALPFHYRLAIALRYIEDNALRDYVDDESRSAIRSGSLDKIMLTGLSDEGLVLLQNYLHITNDIQTAAIASVYVVPRYIRKDKGPGRWRDGYRHLLNSWHMYVQRCVLDLQGTRLALDPRDEHSLSEPNQPQAALCCSNCDGPFLRESVREGLSSGQAGEMLPGGGAGLRSFGGGVLGGPSEVTQCPRCGARMPSCAICDMPTGVLDPLSRGGAQKEREDIAKGYDPLDDLMEVCMTCDHVSHHGCSEAWFDRHRICPAVGCQCHCNDLDDFSSDEDGGQL